MYNAIIKKLPNLTYEELKQVQTAIALEIDYRESKEPINYKCPECPFEGPYGEVYTHLLDKHRDAYTDPVSTAYAPEEVYE